MIRSIVKSAVFILLLSISSLNTVNAKEIRKDVLDTIHEFGSNFCGDYWTGGSTKQFNLNASAKLEVNTFFHRLVNLGVGIAAGTSSEEYIGVLQEDLGEELKDIRKCREMIWKDLEKYALVDNAATPHTPENSYLVGEHILNKIRFEPRSPATLTAKQILITHVGYNTCCDTSILIGTRPVFESFPEGCKVTREGRSSHRGIGTVSKYFGFRDCARARLMGVKIEIQNVSTYDDTTTGVVEEVVIPVEYLVRE